MEELRGRGGMLITEQEQTIARSLLGAERAPSGSEFWREVSMRQRPRLAGQHPSLNVVMCSIVEASRHGSCRAVEEEVHKVEAVGQVQISRERRGLETEDEDKYDMWASVVSERLL